MTGCELCERPARMYCESDEASLCWECDARVHGANFLVARHSRLLLCRRCQGPTPWRAEGARLGPTFSVCEKCCANGEAEVLERGDDEDEGDDDDDDEEEEEEEEEREAVEDGDNQVVPGAPTSLPPPASSSTSEEEESSKGHPKRTRDNADLAGAQALDNRTSSSSGPSNLAAAAEDDAASDGFHHNRRRSGDDAGPGTGALRSRNGQNISAVGFTPTPSRSPPI